MRTRRILGPVVAVSSLLVACEDGPSLKGPEQVFDQTYDEATADPWAVDEGHDFTSESSGDSVGRARFCDDGEIEAQVQDMIKAPIVPDQGIGTVPLWGENYQPLLADDLLGRPESGKFCDPSGTYSNAFTFGPLQEIIVIFNEQTRLVESMYASRGYLGALEGKAKNDKGSEVKVWIHPGDPIRVNSLELRDDAENSTAHWKHPSNINLIYRMLRGTFFPSAPVPPADYDCVESRICRILEIGAYKALRVEDSGVILIMPPSGGAVDTIILEPVRVAPFEAEMALNFGASKLGLPWEEEPPVEEPPVEEPPVEEPPVEEPPVEEPPVEEPPVEEPLPEVLPKNLVPVLTSGIFSECELVLDGKTTWKQFKRNCVKGDDTLSRASYQVLTARDTVRVDFNGVFLTFLRTKGAPLKDGERPGDDDVLMGISFTDNLNAPLTEWIPESLGAHYKVRLEAAVRNSLLASMPDHPFASFALGGLPPLSSESTQLSPLMFAVETPDGVQTGDLVKTYMQIVQQAYAALTPEEKAVVRPDVVKDTFLAAPFVEAALAVLTGGASDSEAAVVTTVPSDDSLYVTGRANFMQGKAPIRVVTQYNFVFGGIVYAGIERGFGRIDAPINAVPALVGSGSPYYEHYLGLTELGLGAQGANPFALGASNITVTGVDRKLGLLSVEINYADASGAPKVYKLKVPGQHIADGAGFNRQTEGETSEFIRSHTLNFYARESSLTVNVDAAGVVQQTTQNIFKGPVFLCGAGQQPFLFYGQDVRAALDAFSKQNPKAFRDCGIVYNYSPNGNVLNSVVSVINKVGVTVSGGRAINASAWQ